MAKKKTAVPESASDQAGTTNGARRRSPARSKTTARSEAVSSAVNEQVAIAHDTADRIPRRPSYDEIATAAYLRYLDRGAGHGQDFDDWVEAEQALRAQASE